MYATCIFCNRPLGENTVIEAFPVGRRLAFDASKGRLWVVCRTCERWTLSPLEERWEAVEDCERLFRGTRLRASTENIGLARHPEGLELVRVGQPLRPEFAAWRYGDQFGRRRKRALMISGLAIVGIGGVAIGGIAVGAISAGLLGQMGNFVNIAINGRTVLKLPTEDGVIKLRQPQLHKVRWTADHDGWVVEVGKRTLVGEDAERAISRIMPAYNRMGGKAADVRTAVERIEESGHPEEFLRRTIREGQQRAQSAGRGRKRKSGTIAALDKPSRLGLEMALHEEQERRALEGELKALELAWKSAEEVAGIADDLLLPEGARSFLADHAGQKEERPSSSSNAMRNQDV
jgi:hypothetical protein